MKQKNLDELRNIYLGLVTGGEGPEEMYESYLEEGPYSADSVKAAQQAAQAGQVKRDAAAVALKTQRRSQDVADYRKAMLPPPVKTFQNTAGDGRYQDPKTQNQNQSKYKSTSDGKMYANYNDALAANRSRNRKTDTPTPAITGSGSGSGSGSGGSTPASTPAASGPKTTSTTSTTPTAPTKPAGSAMDQWTRANPTLAAKVKPGQSGYDTIKTRLSADNDRGPSTPTPAAAPKPAAAEPSGETDRLKKALDIKKSDVTSSYQFPMSKTLRDLSDSYNEIYEAKKKLDPVGQEDDDIDNDGDIDKSDKYLLNRRKVRSKAIGEATAMSKRGLDEPAIRNQIASKTRGGSFADKATALADKETYGDKKKKEGREKLARTQRGDFRNTTSSSPGLRGYGYKSDDPEVKAKQDARGNQRGRAALTPNERKQLNMEYDLYDLIQSHLLEYGFADTEEGANVIIENMSQSWIKQILSED